MIELYTWPTPNGRKISIALEEFELEYNPHAINIGKDEQYDPAFLKISPNNWNITLTRSILVRMSSMTQRS